MAKLKLTEQQELIHHSSLIWAELLRITTITTTVMMTVLLTLILLRFNKIILTKGQKILLP